MFLCFCLCVVFFHHCFESFFAWLRLVMECHEEAVSPQAPQPTVILGRGRDECLRVSFRKVIRKRDAHNVNKSDWKMWFKKSKRTKKVMQKLIAKRDVTQVLQNVRIENNCRTAQAKNNETQPQKQTQNNTKHTNQPLTNTKTTHIKHTKTTTKHNHFSKSIFPNHFPKSLSRINFQKSLFKITLQNHFSKIVFENHFSKSCHKWWPNMIENTAKRDFPNWFKKVIAKIIWCGVKKVIQKSDCRNYLMWCEKKLFKKVMQQNVSNKLPTHQNKITTTTQNTRKKHTVFFCCVFSFACVFWWCFFLCVFFFVCLFVFVLWLVCIFCGCVRFVCVFLSIILRWLLLFFLSFVFLFLCLFCGWFVCFCVFSVCFCWLCSFFFCFMREEHAWCLLWSHVVWCVRCNGQDRETNVSTAYMLLHGNLCYKKSVTQKCCSSQVSTRDEYTLPAERETPNALVVVWSGNEARHGSRNVTLHRLRLSAYSRDLSQRIPG